jgi:hypothetical protein
LHIAKKAVVFGPGYDAKLPQNISLEEVRKCLAERNILLKSRKRSLANLRGARNNSKGTFT